jgi:Protein of unknown function (DUF1573)/HYDIN/CFA65/VesB-like, Ig-like domain
MKRILSPVILTLCAVILPVGLASAQGDKKAEPSGGPSPKAVIEQAVVDVGTVAKGDKITQDFVISNQGNAPLEITDVKPTCGCTVASYDHTIAPGASGKVHAVVDTTNFSGPVAKAIAVYTNDPANARLELTIRAKIQPYLMIQPGFARFTLPQGSDPGVVENIIFTPTFDNLEITKVDSPYPFLKAEYRLATGDEPRESGVGKQWVLTLTLDYSKAPVGTIADYVTIHTNHPQQPIAKLPISGFVRPMIAVTPPAADFGEIDVSKQQEARMIIRSFAAEDVDVTSAETDVPGVTLAVTTIEAGKRFALQVTLTPQMAKGAFNGTITIHTNSPKKPVVEVPLRGTVI